MRLECKPEHSSIPPIADPAVKERFRQALDHGNAAPAYFMPTPDTLVRKEFRVLRVENLLDGTYAFAICTSGNYCCLLTIYAQAPRSGCADATAVARDGSAEERNAE